MNNFLPLHQAEILQNGWTELDIILITGDAYVDHPAFGVALLGRYLVAKGFRVGLIAQPQNDNDYLRLGRPRLFFGISSGNVDSMVNHYTAQRKIRSEDDYSPNKQIGLRPDRAVSVYTQKVKQLFKGIPVVIGGLEASMRRIPHYDFWSDKVKNSLLIDTKANILVYGNGEKQILAIARRLQLQQTIDNILGTCILSREKPDDSLELTNFDTVSEPENFYQMTKKFHQNYKTQILYYRFHERYYLHYPPPEPLTTKELDEIYQLPFQRAPHPKYKGKFIVAFEQIKYSVLSHRGCYGGCSFCCIGLHQGKSIQSRSIASILDEIRTITRKSYFKGTITDLAGPSANMYGTFCKKKVAGSCPQLSCLYPDLCKYLEHQAKPYLELLATARQLPGVANVFVSSGVRFDLALAQPELISELCFFYTPGYLKLAPEHVSSHVLAKMYKPSIKKYLQFTHIFTGYVQKIAKKQYIIPYLIVGFPGTTKGDALELKEFLQKNYLKVEQIQEFTPTPMTIATMMYYTGIDFTTGEKIYVPKGKDIREQKNLAMWWQKQSKGKK